MNKKHEWLQMSEQIAKDRKHSKEFWSFDCLISGTKLLWDIGEKIYYCFESTVHKGIVISVNPAGMCWISEIPKHDGMVLIHCSKLYKNVRYALCEADYNIKNSKAEQPK